jgi:predicted ATPase
MTLLLTQVDIRGDRYPDVGPFPFNIPPLAGRQTLSFRAPVTFLVGENGSGKSTFIQALARRCDVPLWGQPQRARAAGEVSVCALCEYLFPSLTTPTFSGGFFSAEGFRSWAEFLDDVARIDPGQAKYQGGPELTARSHGQGILEYFRCRYQIPGLYFLDEPESALSPASQIELLRLLASCGRSGHAQFLIATHSPILMALPGSLLFHFGETGIVERPYEATEHFRLYRDFLSDPGAYLADL